MLHISELTSLDIPKGMRLWFGGFIFPTDLNSGEIIKRDGTKMILTEEMLDNIHASLFYHSFDPALSNSDIIAYTSRIDGYDLSVEEQFLVEKMAIAIGHLEESRIGITDKEKSQIDLGQYSEGNRIREAALIAYLEIREHVKPNPFPEKWAGDMTVGNMISNLHTLPLDMRIHSAYHVSIGGETKCRIKHPTVSRERVDGREIKTGDDAVPYSAVLWSQCRNAEDNLKE